ncbi:MAG: exodeoxyribonuclease VII small subunit [Clostridium sp.]|jgi:exodeoxyribonuclease VII small subunit|nr:exodeoxyribonuclease VII small subunit [Clostridium sp.]CCZ17830.1 exodeoxyribonuclease VII small subunit [Clostridium sp. CAG:780]
MKEDINFEDAMKELEKIAEELEKGNLSLDESVSKFEDGMKLSKKCSDLLDTAEKKITMLINDNGTIKEENFNVANIEE